jgi:hypothetical protein
VRLDFGEKYGEDPPELCGLTYTMGLSLEFHLGDTEAIRQAVRDIDLDRLYDPTVVKAKADLSLHITPHDLDTLSQEFAVESRQEPLDLRPHLKVLFDDVDRGVFLVDDCWISYIAAVPMAAVRKVTERWFDRISQEYGDPIIPVSAEALKRVEDLVALCARAKKDDESIAHVWFL